MRWNFHGLIIEGTSNNAALSDRWRQAFASLMSSEADPDLSLALDVVSDVPARPAGEPQYRQGDLLEYSLDARVAVAHFPRFGQLRLDLANGATEGQITPATLTTYGVFEDLIAIGLSPHLRRRGLFLIHAFGAATPHTGRRNMNVPAEGMKPGKPGLPNSGRLQPGVETPGTALLVGGIGSGKTTTGMSLLNADWKLLSNDSPVLTASTEVLSYPGLLAAYPDTLARFEATADAARAAPGVEGRQKLTIAAESIWPNVWIDRAPARAIFFPQIESRPDHAVERLTPPEVLRRLLPHAVEQWDRDLIPEHLRVLRLLVEAAPAYLLRLGPDILSIPAHVESAMRE